MAIKNDLRYPAVAGLFYPDHPAALQKAVENFCTEGRGDFSLPVRALIAPHAGYIYSGPIAGSAFQCISMRKNIKRVVLAGPTHHIVFKGFALPDYKAFLTPLGEVPLDAAGTREALSCPGASIRKDVHAPEHALEVMLPFLQVLLSDFTIIPIVVGQAPPEQLKTLWSHFANTPETLLLVSSDLSHYRSYEEAMETDAKTSRAIAALDPVPIGPERACGHIPLQGLLMTAREQGWTAQILDVRNSGDTAGSRERVVGYGAYAFI